jgi:hypothetical protein
LQRRLHLLAIEANRLTPGGPQDLAVGTIDQMCTALIAFGGIRGPDRPARSSPLPQILDVPETGTL